MDENEKTVLKRFAENDTFAASIGIRTTGFGEGTARCEMEITAKHLNSAGIVHGGVVFSLADAAFSVASNSHGTLAVAIETSISYFKAKREGRLIAEAKESSRNPRLATYLIEVRDEANELIALFKGTVYRKRETLEEALGAEGL
jgi:acyl-CoA thioesterase